MAMYHKVGFHYLLIALGFLHYNPSYWYTFLTHVRHTFIYFKNSHIFYSTSMKFFLAAYKTFKFILTMLLVVTVSNVDNWECIYIEPKCKLIWAMSKMILKCIFGTNIPIQDYFWLTFLINIFSIDSATIKYWHSTVPLLNRISAAVVHVSIFNFSFICR